MRTIWRVEREWTVEREQWRLEIVDESSGDLSKRFGNKFICLQLGKLKGFIQLTGTTGAIRYILDIQNGFLNRVPNKRYMPIIYTDAELVSFCTEPARTG